MSTARRRRFWTGLTMLILAAVLVLAGLDAHPAPQVVRAQGAVTPVAIPPLETPLAPVEGETPPAAEPTPSPTAPAAADLAAADAAPTLTLHVETPDVAFGRVSAGGAVDPSAPGVVAVADGATAHYVMPRAVSVTVTGDGPWTGLCAATENAGSATDIRVAGGRLAWRLAGTETWTPFTVGDGAVCFTGEGGARTYVFDLRLSVHAADGAGTFSTLLTVQALP